MKAAALILLAVLALAAPSSATAGEKCVGRTPCPACKSCKYCQHCKPLHRGKGWENFRRGGCGACIPISVV